MVVGKKKKLVIFDLDGTLTETKSALESFMAKELIALLKRMKVAVIGGGTYGQFKKQFISHLSCPPELLAHLFLFPTTATSFYRYQHGWKKVYAFDLPQKEKKQIRIAFRDVLKEIHYVHPKKTYGKVLEDRGTQMSFSFLGQDVVARLGKRGVRLKKEWTRKNTSLKLKIAGLVAKKLPNLEVRAAGYTTIDVTRKGIDKQFGIMQMKKYLHIPIKNMIFVGDAIYPGGNDYAVVKTGVDYIKVSGPKETKYFIKNLLQA